MNSFRLTVVVLLTAGSLQAVASASAGPTLATTAAASTSGQTCAGVLATIVGTSGADVIKGTPGSDVIVALGGRDRILGRGGNDVICAGGGNDTVLGGSGTDYVFGQGGADTLKGGRANDLLDGGAGDDILVGGSGSDVLRGRSGADGLKGKSGNDTLRGHGGNDQLNGGGEIDDCLGGGGADTLTNCEDDDTNEELAARTAAILGAQWSDNVTISVNGSTATFTSDGLPAHEVLDQYLADGPDGKYVSGGVSAYDAEFTFPVVPTVATSPTSTGNGAIGVAISGAVFFDPYEGNGSSTVANDDNETIDGVPFIDACGGHPLPNSISYHYHGIPFCITDAIDTPGEHSALIGFLFDGYGIYGPQDVGGEEPTDLDACLGHTGPTPDFPEGVYHYHVSSQANYISECLHGVVASNGHP